MAKVKLKKGHSIGGLSAENDEYLEKAFVDLGHLQALLNTTSPVFLLLGRTGSGKTALLERVKGSENHVSVLHPEELSMQYIHNSTVLKMLVAWGVNLDIFYKYLWRHVCILELIRMRYGAAEDVPSMIQLLFPLEKLINRERQKARQVAQDYLKNYAGDYWIKTDTRIKTITNELTVKLKEDSHVGVKLAIPGTSAGLSVDGASEYKYGEKVDQETIARAQTIVSDFLVADLNKVIELLSKHGFNDDQKRYFLLIDDLDKDWMPDDTMYLDVVKSLISCINELNHRLRGVKVLVSLRDNIFYRVYKKTSQHEPQREKLADVILRLRWSEPELINLVSARLHAVFHHDNAHPQPNFSDILPAEKKKAKENPVTYVLERTFMRPRDIIAFVNTYIETTVLSDASGKPSWANLYAAEASYSKGRLDSIHDEWKDSFYGLPALYRMLGKLGRRFTFTDMGEEDLNDVILNDIASVCPWLRKIQDGYLQNRLFLVDVRKEVLKALYLTGVIGVAMTEGDHIVYSFQQPTFTLPWDTGEETLQSCRFHIHKMFWKALGVRDA